MVTIRKFVSFLPLEVLVRIKAFRNFFSQIVFAQRSGSAN